MHLVWNIVLIRMSISPTRKRWINNPGPPNLPYLHTTSSQKTQGFTNKLRLPDPVWDKYDDENEQLALFSNPLFCTYIHIYIIYSYIFRIYKSKRTPKPKVIQKIMGRLRPENSGMVESDRTIRHKLTPLSLCRSPSFWRPKPYLLPLLCPPPVPLSVKNAGRKSRLKEREFHVHHYPTCADSWTQPLLCPPLQCGN